MKLVAVIETGKFVTMIALSLVAVQRGSAIGVAFALLCSYALATLIKLYIAGSMYQIKVRSLMLDTCVFAALFLVLVLSGVNALFGLPFVLAYIYFRRMLSWQVLKKVVGMLHLG